MYLTNDFIEIRGVYNKRALGWSPFKILRAQDISEALLNLFVNYNLADHADKHMAPPELGMNEEFVATKDFSYWKKPEKVYKRLTKIFHTCYHAIVEFIANNAMNVLVLKLKSEKVTGYLCKKGESEFKKVYWYCVVVEKTPEGLITKTCYPCEDPHLKNKNT